MCALFREGARHRRQRRRRLGDAGFDFGGLALACLVWTSNLAALAWMPWVVLTALRASREGAPRMPAAMLAAGAQILAGSPELVLVTWGFVAALAVRGVRSGLRALVVGATGTLLAAPQIAATWELAHASSRKIGRAHV